MQNLDLDNLPRFDDIKDDPLLYREYRNKLFGKNIITVIKIPLLNEICKYSTKLHQALKHKGCKVQEDSRPLTAQRGSIDQRIKREHENENNVGGSP